MKHIAFALIALCSFTVFAQKQAAPTPDKDALLKADIDIVAEELTFIYEYDQAMREYLLFKTFDRHVTDSIEGLPQEKQTEYLKAHVSKSDFGKGFYKQYITPMDKSQTERLLEMTKKYGFPSNKRLETYYTGKMPEEFNAYLIFLHSPKSYWEEIKTVINEERMAGRINRCQYGHLLWHLNGRKDTKYFLENGYKITKDEDGVERITAVDCD